MIYTDPKSCPICEGAVAVSSNHSCKAYYDDMLKRAVTTSTSGGTVEVTLSDWRSTPYQPSIGIPLSTKSANEIRLEIENKSLREELSQQKFNNKHNLSIDGEIADKIAKLEARLVLLETEREKLVTLLDFYLNGR